MPNSFKGRKSIANFAILAGNDNTDDDILEQNKYVFVKDKSILEEDLVNAFPLP